MKTLIISPHVDDELLGCFSFLNSDCHVLELNANEFHIVSRKERIEELGKLSKLCDFNYTLDPELNTVKKVQNCI